MKNFLLLLFVFACAGAWGQQQNRDLKEGDVVYLSLNGKDIEILISSKNNDSDNSKSVNSKANSANIYFRWINPLRYRINWTDTTMDDERDVLIKKFMSGLSIGSGGIQPGKLDLDVTTTTTNNFTPAEKLLVDKVAALEAEIKKAKENIAKPVVAAELPLKFKDANLISWHIYINEMSRLTSIRLKEELKNEQSNFDKKTENLLQNARKLEAKKLELDRKINQYRRTNLRSAQDEINGIEAEIDALRNEIVKNEDDVRKNSSEIAELQKEVDNIKAEVQDANKFNPDSNTAISKLQKNLKLIEDNSSGDYSEKLLSGFNTLAALKNPSAVSPNITIVVSEIAKIEDSLKKVKEYAILVKDGMTNFDSKNLKYTSSAYIDNFLTTVNKNISRTEKGIGTLKELMKMLLESVEGDNVAIKQGKETYYRVRTINFDDGKKLQTEVVVSEYAFNITTHDFSKKEDIVSQKLTFRKFDRFNITFSVGVFYGSTSLSSYGIATDGSGAVTENKVEKSNAVAAAFLNIDLRISRYFAPLIQLGLDPTKKSPFLLFGTGFMIPAVNIAITGGPIWTWEQSLKSLEVGESVPATTKLEDDIDYKFNIKPKGWYIGFQYNF